MHEAILSGKVDLFTKGISVAVQRVAESGDGCRGGSALCGSLRSVCTARHYAAFRIYMNASDRSLWGLIQTLCKDCAMFFCTGDSFTDETIRKLLVLKSALRAVFAFPVDFSREAERYLRVVDEVVHFLVSKWLVIMGQYLVLPHLNTLEIEVYVRDVVELQALLSLHGVERSLGDELPLEQVRTWGAEPKHEEGALTWDEDRVLGGTFQGGFTWMPRDEWEFLVSRAKSRTTQTTPNP